MKRIFFLLLSASAAVAQVKIEVLPVTPVGSWQQRELITTFEDGAQEIVEQKFSMISKEKRGYEDYVWIEVASSGVQINKKGKKKELEPVVARLLLKQWVLEMNTANAVLGPVQLAMEAIVQVGGEEPVHFNGRWMHKVLGLFGYELSYQWLEASREDIAVAGGKWSAFKFKGERKAEAVRSGKKAMIENSGTFWFSPEVPFAFLRAEGKMMVKGKARSWTSELKSYGASGATTQITREPKVLGEPTLVKIFGD